MKNMLVILVIIIFTGCTSDNSANNNELTNSNISIELKKSLAYMGNEG